MIHPGVYRTIGLPALRTWLDAARSPSRVALRHEATRPVLAALVDGGCFRSGSIPARWRRLCGVDHAGENQSGAERLAAPIVPIVKAVLRWESTSVGKAKTVLEGVASAALPGSGGHNSETSG
jgi:hypothetical protein